MTSWFMGVNSCSSKPLSPLQNGSLALTLVARSSVSAAHLEPGKPLALPDRDAKARGMFQCTSRFMIPSSCAANDELV